MHSGRRKLLLADDSPTIRKVVSLTFEDEGFEVFTVGDGDEAMRALEDERPPDLLLADVCMPGPDGYELCERVKRDARLAGVPVVLLVGTFEPFNEAEARRVGADTFLTKPFQSIRDLVSKVGSLLGGGSPREETDEAAREERERAAAPAEEPPRAASVPESDAPRAEPSFADLSADDELIEARPADAFGAAESDLSTRARRRRGDEPAADSFDAASPDFSTPAADGARAFVESKDPDFFFEPQFGTNGNAAHEPAAFGTNGGAGPLTLQDEERAPFAPAGVSTNQTEESEMHEQTSPRVSFDAHAAGSATSDDALLDLGQVDTPATASASEADDFVLDLDFEDEPAPAPVWADAPSAFAEAAHGEQPRHFADAGVSFEEAQPPFDQPSFEEQPFSFDGSASSSAQAEPAESATAEAEDAPWRDVVVQDGPQGFAFGSDSERVGEAPSGVVEPEIVPADEPVPAAVEGEFTDGSVEGDVPRPPTGQSASPFVGAAATPQEPSTAGYVVVEGHTRVEEPVRADQLSREAVDAIARRVVELMSDKVVREIAWEVVPELAELLIKQKLEEERRS